MEEFFVIIDIITCSTALMLGLLFLTAKSENRKANIYLGLFIWSLCMEVFESLYALFLDVLGTDARSLLLQTALFTVPLLYFYVNQTINKSIKKGTLLLLLLPGILINVLYYAIGLWDIVLFRIFEYAFNITILIFILRILRSHQRNVGNFYSDLEQKTLSWIKTIVMIYFGFHFIWIVEDIASIQSDAIPSVLALLSAILTFVTVYWIGYNGFSQNEIFRKNPFVPTPANLTLPSQTNYKENRDHKEELQLFESIKQRIVEQRLFVDPKLTLRSLSLTLQIKEKELSRIINHHTDHNFYHFINGFRVEEFKRLLETNLSEQLSTLGIAQESGFNSKSTFYTAFKSIEGITPREYKLQLKKSE